MWYYDDTSFNLILLSIKAYVTLFWCDDFKSELLFLSLIPRSLYRSRSPSYTSLSTVVRVRRMEYFEVRMFFQNAIFPVAKWVDAYMA